MVERFIAPVLKTGELTRFRGFESRSLRHSLFPTTYNVNEFEIG